MTNEQCAAIINAIGVGFEALLTYGTKIWNKVGDDETDASARQDAAEDIQSKLEDIISNIPDE